MFTRKPLSVTLAIVTFAACLWIGLKLSEHKPLWNDEQYSQMSSVEALSWAEIWTRKVPEGNNSPLFYSIQKIVTALPGYEHKDLWQEQTQNSRFFLRIPAIVFTALAIAILVGYFCVTDGLIGAVLAFIVAITSYMVWGYWAEARPYAMVLFGTMIQAIALDRTLKGVPFRQGLLWVYVAHFFLALTSALSVIQVAAASAVLWLSGHRKIRQIFIYAIVPLAIGFFYYSFAPHNRIWFPPYEGPRALLGANISAGRLNALIIFPLVLAALQYFQKERLGRNIWPMVLWTGLTLLGYILLIGYMKIDECPQAAHCAQVSNRYFMTLTPVGMMAALLLSFALIHHAKKGWVTWLAWAAVLGFMLPRLVKAWRWAAAGGVFN